MEFFTASISLRSPLANVLKGERVSVLYFFIQVIRSDVELPAITDLKDTQNLRSFKSVSDNFIHLYVFLVSASMTIVPYLIPFLYAKSSMQRLLTDSLSIVMSIDLTNLKHVDALCCIPMDETINAPFVADISISTSCNFDFTAFVFLEYRSVNSSGCSVKIIWWHLELRHLNFLANNLMFISLT